MPLIFARVFIARACRRAGASAVGGAAAFKRTARGARDARRPIPRRCRSVQALRRERPGRDARHRAVARDFRATVTLLSPPLNRNPNPNLNPNERLRLRLGRRQNLNLTPRALIVSIGDDFAGFGFIEPWREP